MAKIPARSYTVVSKVLNNAKTTKGIYAKWYRSVAEDNQENITDNAIDAAASIIYLIENTDFKKSIIDEHNKSLDRILELDKRDRKGYEEKRAYIKSEYSSETVPQEYAIKDEENCKSKLRSRTTQMLEQSKNDDIVTEKFRELFNSINSGKCNPEEVFLFNARNYNRLAHRLVDEIDSIRKNLNFSDREKRMGEFTSILEKANELCVNNTDSSDFTFNYKDLKNYIDELNKNGEELVPSLNIETQKAERLIRKVLPNQAPEDIDKEFLMNFCKCVKLKESVDLFFNYKDMSCKSLLLYQDRVKKDCEREGIDAYESEKLKYRVTFIDEEKSLTNGKSSYRMYAGLHKTYNECAKFVDFIVPGNAYAEQLSSQHRVFDTDKVKDMIKINMRQSGRQYVSETEIYAYQSEDDTTIMHIDRDSTDKFAEKKNLKVEKEKTPFIEQLAYRFLPFGIGKKNNKRAKVLNNIVTNCIDNEERYNLDLKLFQEENSLSNIIKKEVEAREEL